MAQMPPLRPILNNTPADAVDVDSNFTTIQTHLRTETINRDGSVAMSAPLTVVEGSQSDHAASRGELSALLPPGLMMAYGGSGAPPDGWERCDGKSVSTTDPKYAALFAVIGHTYGGSGGSFNVPDLKSKAIAGSGYGTGDFAVGRTGGSANSVAKHSHKGPSHRHNIGGHDHSVPNHNHTISGHTHTLSNHTHSINHNHPVVNTSLSGAHNHNLKSSTVASGEGSFNKTNTVSGSAFDGSFAEHRHQVDLPNYTGSSGKPGNNTSGGSGTLTTNTRSGVTTDGSGTLTTYFGGPSGDSSPENDTSDRGVEDGNWPPYIALQWIIKL